MSNSSKQISDESFLAKVFAELTSQRAFTLFIVFCLIQWLFNFVNSEFITTDEVFDDYMEERRNEKYGADYNELSEEFEDDIEDIEDSESEPLIDYIFDFGILTALNFLQLLITSSIILTGLTLNSKTDIFNFNDVFKITTIAHFIFFAPLLVKIIWFAFVDTSYTFEDVKSFYPLSLANFVSTDHTPYWALHPLRTLNLFEIGFTAIIIFGLSFTSKVTASTFVKPVALSYSLLMFMWISFRVYISTLF